MKLPYREKKAGGGVQGEEEEAGEMSSFTSTCTSLFDSFPIYFLLSLCHLLFEP